MKIIVLNLVCCLSKFSSYVLMNFDSITPTVLTNDPHNLVRVYIWNLFFEIEFRSGNIYIYNGCLRFFVKLILKISDPIRRRVECGSLTDVLTLSVYVIKLDRSKANLTHLSLYSSVVSSINLVLFDFIIYRNVSFS